MVLKENYLSLALDEVYDLIVSGTNWPANLEQPAERIEFLQSLIEYYKEDEEYERCSMLQEMINEMENQI